MRKRFLENLGDASPLDHGGVFVYGPSPDDRDGSVECWDEPIGTDGERDVYKVYRFDLERYKMVRVGDSLYMVPFAYREDWPYPAALYRPWFVTCDGGLGALCDGDPQEVEEDLCSADPVARAQVYRMIGEYHGFENLDSYPEEFSRKEMEVRYADELAELSARRCGRGKA